MANRRLRDFQGRTLPNIGSPYATPASLNIDAQYAIAFRQHPWTWDRFIRLCSFLKVTPGELASAVGIPHNELRGFKQEIRLRGPGAMAWQLMLTTYETTAYSPVANPVQPNPLADLDALSKDSGRQGV